MNNKDNSQLGKILEKTLDRDTALKALDYLENNQIYIPFQIVINYDLADLMDNVIRDEYKKKGV